MSDRVRRVAVYLEDGSRDVAVVRKRAHWYYEVSEVGVRRLARLVNKKAGRVMAFANGWAYWSD